MFGMVIEVYEMTVQLQASLEDCLEMAEENCVDSNGETVVGKNYSSLNIGVCFLDLAEVMLLTVVSYVYRMERLCTLISVCLSVCVCLCL